MSLPEKIKESLTTWILLIVAFTASTVYLSLEGNRLWAVLTFTLLILSVYRLIKLYRHNNKMIRFMLDALENNDNAFRFPVENTSGTKRQINQSLNRVATILHHVKAETAQQEKYYEWILNNVNTGIVVLNDNGTVHQKNNEALRLLGLEVFTHVNQLVRTAPELTDLFRNARAGDKLHTSYSNERGTINLSIRVSAIKIKDEQLRILALNDINSELDEREIDSWIRLIRVLTHEIMNSVTPITSISDTLLTISDKEDKELQKGLHTINTTTKSLISFVGSYRKLTRIPTPEPSLFYLKEFLNRMVELTRHQHTSGNIRFRIDIQPDDLILYADESLITQVMVNLLKNAVQAIDNKPGGKISIKSYSNESEEVTIEISDNGPSIPPDIREHIFVPFFTTKTGGSGIGLSISRQIMRMSGGNITLLPSHTGEGSTFVLRFR